MTNSRKAMLPINEKYALTREEAMAYFNIGEKKMRRLVNNHIGDYTFVVFNGRKALIIREKMEEFLRNTSGF